VRPTPGWFRWLPLLAAVPGCLCNDGTPDAVTSVAAASPASEPAPDQSALAARVCDLLQRAPAQRRAACCGSGSSRHFAVECEQALGAALSRGSVQLDLDALAQCAAAVAQERDGCDWVTPSQPLPPAACRSLTRGSVPEAGSCRSSLECAGALHCRGGTASEPGHCAAPEPDGSACHAPVDALATYLFAAELERSHPTCSGSCSLTTQRCDAATAGREAVAVTRRAQPGDACRSDFDCQLGGCVEGVCGMKCAISFARPSAEQPVLAFRRRDRGADVSRSD
jgi:hypothetical protein